MNYRSTRGNKQTLPAAVAIIAGIADDGGLFVPTSLPKVDTAFIEGLVGSSYQKRAVRVLAQFLTDYTDEELKTCINNAYGGQKFDSASVAPLTLIDEETHVLELWHGPTSAFKDMALQLLPQLLSTALRKTGEKAEIVILVATSGDTGKAALEGFKDVEQTRIIVFYPETGVSRIQRLQMVSQKGENVAVVAVNGNFDDAQTGVKHIFNDTIFNAELKAKGFQLSSANSINWGRLAPQIVYYFSAYADLLKMKKIKAGDEVNFVVPTGNFGNILAGYYAKMMGLPIHRLVCASNANNVLTDFLRTGIYNKNRDFHQTNTPSMDILISSNLERLLYHIGNGDQGQINAWMTELQSTGKYDVGAAYLAKIQSLFWAGWVDDAQTSTQIKSVYNAHHYVMDTHTAVAWHVADRYKEATGDQRFNVIVSTASPYKFNESVLSALSGESNEGNDPFTLLDALERLNTVKAPPGLASLREAPILHKNQCKKEEMAMQVKNLLQNLK